MFGHQRNTRGTLNELHLGQLVFIPAGLESEEDR